MLHYMLFICLLFYLITLQGNGLTLFKEKSLSRASKPVGRRWSPFL